MKKILFLSLILFSSCGVSQSDYDKVNTEKDSLLSIVSCLKEEIDELKNGEERLIGLVESSYKDQKYIDTQKYINILKEKHPESSKNEYFKTILYEVNEKAKEELTAIEKQKKRQH